MPAQVPKSRATGWDETAIEAIIAAHKAKEGPLLPILHALQEEFGFIGDHMLPLVADALNLSRAEVFGVVSFYHDFRRAPAGRHVIKLCCAESCQSMGSKRLVGELESAFGTKLGSTSADGRVTLEPVYCLGNCALSPAAMINGKLYGRVDVALAKEAVREAER